MGTRLPTRTRNPRSIPNLLVQAAPDNVRSDRTRLYPPDIHDLMGYGSAERRVWLSNLATHMAGQGPALPSSRYVSPPPVKLDNDHSSAVASCQATPYGQFWRTGRRDPVPPANPGPPPYSTPNVDSTQSPIDRMVWREQEGFGIYPGPVYYRHENPALAGRFRHRHQASTIIWAWRRDADLLTGRSRFVGLTPAAYDAVMLTAADCEAVSAGAILCHEDSLSDLCPPSIIRPGSVKWPLLGTAEEHRDSLDDFREACLQHLGAAALLLRGVPDDILRCALPPDWTYPSFPDGTFYDAVEAYGFLDASFAGIIFDTSMPSLNYMPPLSLFAEWGIAYGWLVGWGSSTGDAWLESSFSWDYTVLWDIHRLTIAVREEEARRQAAVDGHLNRFQRYALVRETSKDQFEKRLRTARTAYDRSIVGLDVQWLTRKHVCDSLLLDRMSYVEHWPANVIVFREWTDLKVIEDYDARRQNLSPASVRGSFSARLSHVLDEDKDDDDDDDPQVIFHKSAELGVSLPRPKLAPVSGPWRVARPPPRFIQPSVQGLDVWLAGLQDGAPPVAAPYVTPQQHQLRATAQPPYEISLPSAGIEAQPPPSSGFPRVGAGDLARSAPPSARPIKQTQDRSPPRMVSPSTDRGRPYERPSRISPKRIPWHARSPPRRTTPRHDSPPHHDHHLRKARGRSRSPSENHADRERTRPYPRRGGLSRSPRRRRGSLSPRGRSPATRERKGKGRMIGERPFEDNLPSLPLFKSGVAGTTDLKDEATALLARAVGLLQKAISTTPASSDTLSTPASFMSTIESPAHPSALSIKGAAAREQQLSQSEAERAPAREPLLTRFGVSLVDRIATTSTTSSGNGTVGQATDDRVQDKSWGREWRRPIPSSSGWPGPTVAWASQAPLEPLGLDFVQCLVRLSPVKPIIDDSWPSFVNGALPSVLTRGRFRLPPGSWLRYLLFQLDFPNSPPEEFLRHAVSRGVPFDLAERGDPYETQDDEMPSPLPEAISLVEWQSQVRRLLQEPRAVQFIRDGGIAWRIAIDLGPASLIADALKGVSVQARRPLPTENSWPASVIVDRPSEYDYGILIGRVRRAKGRTDNRSLFPHPDVWDALFPGEWSSAAEFWYKCRTTEGKTSRSVTFSPRNDLEWRKELRTVAPVIMRPFLQAADPRRHAVFARLGGLPADPFLDVDIEGEELVIMDES